MLTTDDTCSSVSGAARGKVSAGRGRGDPSDVVSSESEELRSSTCSGFIAVAGPETSCGRT